MNNVSVEEAKLMDLQVSRNQVVFGKLGMAVSSENRTGVEVSKLRELVSTSAKAKYSKKNQRMNVTIAGK